jgi:hypothetical protein
VDGAGAPQINQCFNQTGCAKMRIIVQFEKWVTDAVLDSACFAVEVKK